MQEASVVGNVSFPIYCHLFDRSNVSHASPLEEFFKLIGDEIKRIEFFLLCLGDLKIGECNAFDRRLDKGEGRGRTEDWLMRGHSLSSGIDSNSS